jgi:hypothetical protein
MHALNHVNYITSRSVINYKIRSIKTTVLRYSNCGGGVVLRPMVGALSKRIGCP